MVLEQDVLGQIRKDYYISFALTDEEVRRNEKSRCILARSCPSLKSGCTNPKIVLFIIDGVFLQRKCLCGLSENISYSWSALAV
jgi:hypothetical protein